MVVIDGFDLALDRGYDRTTHMWVRPVADDVVRVGMDALGVETSGTLAQLSMEPEGSTLQAGRPFGQLEAAKFVGPLISPVAGTLIAANEAVLLDAGVVERDPYGEGWLIEVRVDVASLEGLCRDAEELIAWFEERIDHYRREGVLAL